MKYLFTFADSFSNIRYVIIEARDKETNWGIADATAQFAELRGNTYTVILSITLIQTA